MSDDFQTEGQRLSEQFRSLKDNHRMVLDWWQKQLTEISYAYQGVSHVLNRSVADAVNTRQELLIEIQGLKNRCEQLELERDQAFAAIGELQSGMASLEERFERMADWAKQQVKR